MSLYEKLGEEVKVLVYELLNPNKRGFAKDKMNEILSLAARIGGPIEMEAELLYLDVMRFLEDPEDLDYIENIKKHALRLEEETKEL